MKREDWTPREFTPKETKMLVSWRYVKNALVWIDRALRRSRIPDEERKAMEDVRKLIIETDMAFVSYCNKYIYNENPMEKTDKEVENYFQNGKT